MNALITIKEITSKKTGNKFEALVVKAGEYSTLVFPTKIEMLYLKQYIKKQAHEDFKDGEELSEEPQGE